MSIANDAALTPHGVKKYVVFNSGVLRLTGAWTTTRNISVLENGGTIDTQAFNATINGNVINPGALVKQGTGTLTLNGANTNATTALTQGTLVVNGSHTGTLTMLIGTTLAR